MATKRKAAKAGKAKTTRAVPAAAAPAVTGRTTAKQKAEEARWQAQSDLRNMEQADAVRNDPARLKAVKAEASRMAKVAGLSGKRGKPGK